MDTQDNITATPQEPVQDGTATNTVRDDVYNRLAELRELNKQLEGTGQYVLLPTDALTERAEAYYNLNADNVLRLLKTSGVEEDAARGVLSDYALLLAGFSDVKLPLKQQAAVLNTVKPWRLQFTERYALTLLFNIYLYNTTATKDYINDIKLATGEVERVTKHVEEDKTVRYERERTTIPVTEQRRTRLERLINRIQSGCFPSLALGYRWVSQNKVEQDGELLQIIEPSDFAGLEPQLINKFYAYVDAHAAIDDYVNYYYIAKYALKATAAELKEIVFPSLFRDYEQAQEYAERIGAFRERALQEKAEDVEKMIAADNVEDIKKAQQEITATPSPEPQDTIRIPETFALLGSRDVYATVDGGGQLGKGILPIQAFIQDYMKTHNLTEHVTPRTVEKVIEGINLLQRLHNVKPERGRYTFETNISEFAGLIGFDDANQTEKMEIMRALQVLDGLYLAVWRSDGLHAVRVFTIQDIGLTGKAQGLLTLEVNADTMKGHPNLISYKDFDAMRKASKGQAENHFRYQILSKGQKEEEALLNEVFGYDTLLKEITITGGTVDDVAKAKRNIEKHQSRDKRRLAAMFEDYKTRGWLTNYTYTKNGQRKGVYKWKRGNIPQEQPATVATSEPDEQ